MKQRLLHLAAVAALAFSLVFPGAGVRTTMGRSFGPTPYAECETGTVCPN
jgi:hypothetical protein